MENIQQLVAERYSLIEEMKSITAEAEKRDTKRMTEAEGERWQHLNSEVDRLKEEIERTRRMQELEMENTPDHPAQGESTESGAGEQRFASMGDMLQAVVAYGREGRVDPRLFEQRQPSGLNEGVPSEGGFFVEKQWAQEMLQRMFEESPVLNRVDKTTLTGPNNGLKLRGVQDHDRRRGNRFGGIQTYWLEEAGTKTPEQPAFRKIELELKKIAGFCYLTDELIQDAGALTTEVSNWFSEDMDFEIVDAIIRGDGAGKPLGILNSPALVTVGAEAGQAAATILYENIVNMYSRMFARYRPNAVWLVNQDIEPQLFTMSLAVGVGGVPVYMPANGAAGSPFGMLMGRPVIPVEQASTLGQVGDIMFVDLRQYKAIDKGGVRQDTSIHVRFLNDETALRFVYRFDGQPKWDQPVQPAQGNNTLSPFVALEAR